MPILFTIIGLLLIVTGVQNTHKQFSVTLGNDLVGDANHAGFIWWIAAIGSVGAIGYIGHLRTISRLFLVLIIIGMLVANPAFFTEVNKAVKEGPIKPLTAATAKDANNMTGADIETALQRSSEISAELWNQKNLLQKAGSAIGWVFGASEAK